MAEMIRALNYTVENIGATYKKFLLR